MEVYTGLVSFSMWSFFFLILNTAVFVVVIYIVYLVIKNLQLSKKLLTKKCQDEGLMEKRNDTNDRD